jgi:WXG100 family type VII secretion target
MAAAAGKFDTAGSEIATMLQRLQTELDQLYSGWKGAGANAFQQVRARWESDVRKLQQALSETAGAIKTSGQQYTASDDAATGRANAIQTTVQLPL